ncbi:hypothetical protein OG883_41090 [Streptomyces sp. NBC_01142]|uniref:hypothetical protein n=1 Tax=Streptomyces sp. NBC_01142 TaxID=2975865 RepID=UPI00224D34E6|nr:hypothetical protein [Streptomyces sp. NBC_01142]MCX4826068.1 hypothetical protein [Streptomyces sp. NBC_01142]
MFTSPQIEHCRTFGFVVLRGLFSPQETARLTAEVTELRFNYPTAPCRCDALAPA